MSTNKTLIFIPTYNEAENVGHIYQLIKGLRLEADILFLDDNSPDSTGKIIDRLVSENPGTFAIHRNGKLGIGSAHLDGIRYAYKSGYEFLITMDCDLTHSPEYIKDFIGNSKKADIIVGSRYMREDSLASWNLYRKFLTRLGHFLTRVILGMPYDASGAFRLYHINKINRNAFDLISSKGYSFFFESLFILHLNKYTIIEIPIDLPSRTYGHSKMKTKDILTSVKYLGLMLQRKLFNRRSLICITNSDKIVVGHTNIDAARMKNEWETYWKAKDKPVNALYDLIARFYRRFIITGILNHFIKKYFSSRQQVLHAGCGSGLVDKYVSGYLSITALDISEHALKIYTSINGSNSRVVQGNIFNLPFGNETFEGIYNLGVMEHFTEEKINAILLEFNRVLKPGAKMVILWPPVGGFTVKVLDSIHFILNKILRQNIKLHPDEITRISSKQHAMRIFERSGFKLEEYYFGIRDLFTQAVIVVRKDS